MNHVHRRQCLLFYEALRDGRHFNHEDRVRFLAGITGWPTEKAAAMCGVISDLGDDEHRHDVAVSIAFHLMARAGHCGEYGEVETLAYLTGWTNEYAEFVIEHCTEQGYLVERRVEPTSTPEADE